MICWVLSAPALVSCWLSRRFPNLHLHNHSPPPHDSYTDFSNTVLSTDISKLQPKRVIWQGWQDTPIFLCQSNANFLIEGYDYGLIWDILKFLFHCFIFGCCLCYIKEVRERGGDEEGFWMGFKQGVFEDSLAWPSIKRSSVIPSGQVQGGEYFTSPQPDMRLILKRLQNALRGGRWKGFFWICSSSTLSTHIYLCVTRGSGVIFVSIYEAL